MKQTTLGLKYLCYRDLNCCQDPRRNCLPSSHLEDGNLLTRANRWDTSPSEVKGKQY